MIGYCEECGSHTVLTSADEPGMEVEACCRCPWQGEPFDPQEGWSEADKRAEARRDHAFDVAKEGDMPDPYGNTSRGAA